MKRKESKLAQASLAVAAAGCVSFGVVAPALLGHGAAAAIATTALIEIKRQGGTDGK